jgi:hypothetical protein
MRYRPKAKKGAKTPLFSTPVPENSNDHQRARAAGPLEDFEDRPTVAFRLEQPARPCRRRMLFSRLLSHVAGMHTRPARHPSLNLEVCCVDKRVARHREIDFVRPGRQPCRLEVENVSARATQRGVEAEVIIRV